MTEAFGSVGSAYPGSPVLAEGSRGTDASLAGCAKGEGDFANVVCSASVGRAVVGSSCAVVVNAIGGSKRARVVFTAGLVSIPVDFETHTKSRENTRDRFLGPMKMNRLCLCYAIETRG